MEILNLLFCLTTALDIAVAALENILALITSRDSRLGRRRRLRLCDTDESAVVGKH